MTTGILGVEGTGYLTVAFVINFGMIELFSTTVLVAAYPLLSRYYGEGKNPIFGFLIEKLTLYMVVIGLPMALFVSLLAPDVISSFFGEQNAVTAGILSISDLVYGDHDDRQCFQQSYADSESSATAACLPHPWD